MRKSPTECRAGGRTGRKVWSVVRQENEREDQGEGVQNSGKTSTDVRGRDMGVEEVGPVIFRDRGIADLKRNLENSKKKKKKKLFLF